jgi:hypothetical protein
MSAPTSSQSPTWRAMNPNGQFAASVTVFSGVLDASGTQCVGTQLGMAAVSAVDGSWEFNFLAAKSSQVTRVWWAYCTLVQYDCTHVQFSPNHLHC